MHVVVHHDVAVQVEVLQRLLVIAERLHHHPGDLGPAKL